MKITIELKDGKFTYSVSHPKEGISVTKDITPSKIIFLGKLCETLAKFWEEDEVWKDESEKKPV